MIYNFYKNILHLYLLTETYFFGYTVEILYFFSFISILSGLLVITSNNPIVSVLCLISLFLSVSGYLITIGINFIGLSYLLVYVGAVSILFLFILMLINVRISELLNNTDNSIILAVIISILFLYSIDIDMIPFFNETYSGSGAVKKDLLINNNEIMYVTSIMWDGNLAENPHITSIGNIMYTSFSIWLIIISFILLLAMVGTICLVIS